MRYYGLRLIDTSEIWLDYFKFSETDCESNHLVHWPAIKRWPFYFDKHSGPSRERIGLTQNL